MSHSKRPPVAHADIAPLIEGLRSGNLVSDLDAVTIRLKELGPGAIPILLFAMAEGKITAANIGFLFSGLGGVWLRELIAYLNSKDDHLKLGIIKALAFFDKDAWSDQLNTAIPHLVETLSAANPLLRKESAITLGTISTGTADVILALIKSSTDESKDVRLQSLFALGQFGSAAKKAIAQVQPMLKDDDPDIRRYAIETLVKIGMSENRITPLLADGLRESDPRIRSGSVQLLPFIGTWSKELQGLVLRALVDPNDDVRLQTLKSLEAAKGQGVFAVGAVSLMFEDPNTRIAITSIETVWVLTGRPEKVVPALLDLAKREISCSERLCDAVAKIGAPAKPLVPHLIQGLQSSDHDLQWAAASALSQVGPGAEEAVPNLVGILGHPSNLVASMGASAIAKIGVRALPKVIRALDSQDAKTREYAKDALGQMGELAGASVPKLLRSLLESKREEERCWAAIALGEIAGVKEMVPRLTNYLGSSDTEVSARAARALGKIGKDARSSLPTLSSLVAAASPRVSSEAKAAIELITASQ